MGRSTRSVQRERMSQAKLDSLIIRPTAIPVEREHIEPKGILLSNLEYDTLHPEETIRDFASRIRAMLERYRILKEQENHLEQEMQDLLHYMEMGSDKNANTGYKLYKQLAEIRRERRICKNEMDLLQVVFDAFNSGEILSTLAQIQGNCRITKQSIDNRVYTVRTDVLDSFK